MPKRGGRLTSVISRLIRGSPYTQRQWARILGVEPASVSYWVSGENIPSPENLRAIVRVCREELDGSLSEELAELWKLMPLPLREVTAAKQRAEESLGDYYLTPLYDAVRRVYLGLPVDHKERVLRVAGDVGHYPDKPHLGWLWPGLSRTVTPELRDIIHGLSQASHAKQEQFLDAARSEYFATVLERADPLGDRVAAGARGAPVERRSPDCAFADALAAAASVAAAWDVDRYVSNLPNYTRAVGTLSEEARTGALLCWSENLSCALRTAHDGYPVEAYPSLSLNKAVQEELLEHVNEPVQREFRVATLQAYSRCDGHVAAVALDLDKQFWRKRITTSAHLADRALTDADSRVWGEIARLITSREDLAEVSGTIRMNASPYAECAWQIILRVLVGRLTKAKLDLVPAPWRAVRDMLEQRRINIAMFNATLQSRVKPHISCSKYPLFLYHGYEMVIGRTHLESVIASVAEPVRLRLSQLCEDGIISEDELDRPGDQEAVRTIFEDTVVYVPKDTDMHRAIQEFLKRFNVERSDVQLQDDANGAGIRALVEGRAEVLFGGNNDVHYLRTNFPGQAALAIHVPDRFVQGLDLEFSDELGAIRNHHTDVFFFTKTRRRSVAVLEALWPWVHRLWDVVVGNCKNLDQKGLDLSSALGSYGDSWRERLKLHVVSELNRSLCNDNGNTDHYAGFLEDFDAVQRILSNHNEWGARAKTLGYVDVPHEGHQRNAAARQPVESDQTAGDRRAARRAKEFFTGGSHEAS